MKFKYVFWSMLALYVFVVLSVWTAYGWVAGLSLAVVLDLLVGLRLELEIARKGEDCL